MELSEHVSPTQLRQLWTQQRRRQKAPDFLARTKPATWPPDWPWPPRAWLAGCQCAWCTEARRTQGQSAFLRAQG